MLALGTEEQKERWLRPLAGERPPMTALATTEPDFGSDAAGMRTAAKRVDGGYVLNGQKAWISNGGIAQFYVVFATVAPGTGHRGVTAFLLERDDAGLSFGAPMRKMGQRAIVNTELFLQDCFVADDRRLGEEGAGFRGLMDDVRPLARDARRARPPASPAPRSSTRPRTRKERDQFGRPIVEHQAVAFRLADMALRVDASRLLAWRAARMLDRGERATTEAAMAKLHASETAMACTWGAVQTLGGWGYSREYPVEKWMRDAKLEEIEEGTSDIQRLVISRGLLGRDAVRRGLPRTAPTSRCRRPTVRRRGPDQGAHLVLVERCAVRQRLRDAVGDLLTPALQSCLSDLRRHGHGGPPAL